MIQSISLPADCSSYLHITLTLRCFNFVTCSSTCSSKNNLTLKEPTKNVTLLTTFFLSMFFCKWFLKSTIVHICIYKYMLDIYNIYVCVFYLVFPNENLNELTHVFFYIIPSLSLGSLRSYMSNFKSQLVWLSKIKLWLFHIFMRYIEGKLYLPRKITKCSSAVKIAPGIRVSSNVMFHKSNAIFLQFIWWSALLPLIGIMNLRYVYI